MSATKKMWANRFSRFKNPFSREAIFYLPLYVALTFLCCFIMTIALQASNGLLLHVSQDDCVVYNIKQNSSKNIRAYVNDSVPTYHNVHMSQLMCFISDGAYGDIPPKTKEPRFDQRVIQTFGIKEKS